jgi:hypothetical protein
MKQECGSSSIKKYEGADWSHLAQEMDQERVPLTR